MLMPLNTFVHCRRSTARQLLSLRLRLRLLNSQPVARPTRGGCLLALHWCFRNHCTRVKVKLTVVDAKN
jgi:hypothetical protein